MTATLARDRGGAGLCGGSTWNATHTGLPDLDDSWLRGDSYAQQLEVELRLPPPWRAASSAPLARMGVYALERRLSAAGCVGERQRRPSAA